MIAVSGATGFIGGSVTQMMRDRGLPYTGISRADFAESRLHDRLAGVTTIIHLAGLAHEAARAEEFDAANHMLTATLANAAVHAGVKRIIYVSSISAAVRQQSPYGKSKLAAEQAVLFHGDALEAVIVRPPLVYGRLAPANFGKLLRLCDTPVPLPFGAVSSKRSLIGVTNLADCLLFLAHHSSASAVYEVSDGPPLTLSDIVCRIRRGLNRPPRLVPIPVPVLRMAMTAIGRASMTSQLLDDLVVDDHAVRQLGWVPPYEALDAREIACNRRLPE